MSRTDHARLTRERLAALVQAEEEIAALRKELARAKAGDLGEQARAELDAFASIRAELHLPTHEIADEVERMAGRLALLERLFAAVVDAYGPSDAADCDQVRADLKRFTSIPDEALDLAEALVAEIGPEPVTWLAQRFRTVPALRGARTAREVAAVLATI